MYLNLLRRLLSPRVLGIECCLQGGAAHVMSQMNGDNVDQMVDSRSDWEELKDTQSENLIEDTLHERAVRTAFNEPVKWSGTYSSNPLRVPQNLRIAESFALLQGLVFY